MMLKTEWVECLELLVVSAISLMNVVAGRECYNYKEEPRVRQCSNGCCGEDYAEYCCDATMQIMGSVLGGLVVIGIIIAVAVYCYTRKSKRRQMTSGGGILGHLGSRRNPQNTQPPGRTVPPQVPRGRVFRIPSQARDTSPFAGGGAYYNSNNQQVSLAPPGAYDYNQSGMQYPPTAPMPPPYASTAPPPYSALKESPPDYMSVATLGHTGVTTHGQKPDGYTDGMTPPAY